MYLFCESVCETVTAWIGEVPIGTQVDDAPKGRVTRVP